MKTLLLTTAAVFLVSLLVSPTLGAGWFWDLGNSFGLIGDFAARLGLKVHRVTLSWSNTWYQAPRCTCGPGWRVSRC